MVYGAPPSYRLPYDPDGTYVYRSDANFGNQPVELTTDEKRILNNEATSWDFLQTQWNNPSEGIGFLFPTATNIAGVHFQIHSTNGNYRFDWSSNTTNGVDGTWTTFTATPYSPTTGLYRTINVPNPAITSAKAIRMAAWAGVANYVYIGGAHLYGTNGDDGLQMWHPSSNSRYPVSGFDFGDVLRGQVVTKQFRVKNSASQTANNVTVSTTVLTNAAVPLGGQVSYSLDGTNYSSSISLGNIGAGLISTQVPYIKYAPPTNATVGPWAFRIAMTAGSWT